MREFPWLIFILFAASIYSGQTGAVPTPVSCKIEEKILDNMPARRTQGSDNTCAAMALATALDYRGCRLRHEAKCSESQNTISVLDLIKKGTNGEKFDLLDASKLLKNVNGRQIARERCAPYARLFPKERMALDLYRDLVKASTSLRSGLPLETSQCNSISHFAGFVHLPYMEVSNRISKLSFAQFINSLSVPEACKDDSLEISGDYLFANYDYLELTFKGLSQTVHRQLTKSQPIIWRFCDVTKIEGPCPANSAHLVVIFGQRKTCCDDVCRSEYLVRDSSNQVSTLSGQGNKTGDLWVSEDFVLARTRAIIASDIANGIKAGAISWIE